MNLQQLKEDSYKPKKKPNFKINAIFNAVYQILILIVPLITTPYIATIFTSDIVGSYSFGYSTVQYFVLAADFGFTMYGTTLIAQNRNNPQKENKAFWGLTYCKLSLDIIVLLIYFSLLGFGVFSNESFPLNTNFIYLIFSINIFSSLFDFTFLFQGKEKFVSLCVRNLIVKLFSAILIFIFVKTQDDYFAYVLIMCLSFLLSSLITLVKVPFLIGKPIKVEFYELTIHFKKSLIFFVPSVATTLYTIASKSILGFVQGDSAQNGYFEQATKIIDIIVALVNSVNTIMLSRMAFLYANNLKEEINNKVKKIFQLYSVFAFSCFFGILGIGDYLTLGFLGENFDGSVILVYILACKIIVVPISGILGSVYYIPNGKLVKRAIYLVAGAIFNLIFNTLLVYFFAATGAAIASVATELLVTFLYFIGCRKSFNFKELFKDFIRCVPIAIIMFAVVFLLKSPLLNLCSSILSLYGLASDRINYFATAAVLAVIGCVLYYILLLIVREPLVTSITNNMILKLKTKLMKMKKKNDTE